MSLAVVMMAETLILVIDGNDQTRQELKKLLAAGGCDVHTATDGISALMLFRRHDYDLIITETKLHELDGKSVCRQIKKTSDTPIMVLSSCGDEETKLEYFALGIEDYILKPYSALELLARVAVVLRRNSAKAHALQRNLVFDGLFIDVESRTVYVDESPVNLTPKEYDLLLYLAKNPNKAFSRDMLLNAVWGQDFFGTERTVDTHIKTLRDALTEKHSLITTIWGYGYKFVG
jgi:two-component system response regulator ResD